MDISRGPYARRLRGNSPQRVRTTTEIAECIREACKAAYGESRSAAKELAADSASSPRAAENWLSGDNPMSLTAFLNAYANNTAFRAHARKLLLMEQDLDPTFQAELSRFIATVKERG